MQAAVSVLLFKNMKEKLLFLSYLTLIIKCCGIPWQSKSFMQHFSAACRVSQEDLEGKKYNLCRFSKQKLLNFYSRRLFMENTFSFCVRKKIPQEDFFSKYFLTLVSLSRPLSQLFAEKLFYLFIFAFFADFLPDMSLKCLKTTKVSHTKFYSYDFFL